MDRPCATIAAACLVASVAVACGGSGGSPNAPAAAPLPPAASPSPLPARQFPPTGLPSLATCGEQPNYLREVDALYRRERFPLRVSVLRGGGGAEYFEGIRAGLLAWDMASGGVIGAVDIRMDGAEADIFVEVGTHPVYDCRNPRTAWHGIFADPTIVPPRVLRGGRIHICPENFGASPDDVERVALVVAHEMGHALGIGGHSSDPGDLMYGGDVEVGPPPAGYPWVTARDLNTLATAYCN